MNLISSNGFRLTPGSKVRKDGKTGMWDGPCGCSDCKALPGWAQTKGTVLGGELDGSFEACELEYVSDDATSHDPDILHMSADGTVRDGNARLLALKQIKKV